MKRIINIISALMLVLLLNVTSSYAAPSTQARNIAFSDITSNSAKITWINGNGGNRIVVVYNNTTNTGNPVNGTNYTANSIFGSGSSIVNGNTTGWVVYQGGGSTRSVTVTNLVAGSTYRVMVYEYNNIPNNFDFNVSTATNNPRDLKTAIAVPTGLATSNIGANTATTTWNAVSGATGYEFLLTQGGNPVPEYNKIDIGNVVTYDLTFLTKSTTYNWTVAAYNSDDQSANAPAVAFTTLNDVTPPTFTVKYFSNNTYTNQITLPATRGMGTYYLEVTSSEPLVSAPTINSINAHDGTANDKTNLSTNQISSTTFGYTRVIVFDNNSDNGLVAETISVTGTDLNGNTGTTNNLNGLKIDTKKPEFSDIELGDNYTLNIYFNEPVQTTSNGPLTASNFVVTLVNGTGSGVTGVSVTGVSFQNGLYTLDLAYTALNYFGAPYAGTPGITVSARNVKDLYENTFDETYTSPAFDLLLTPIKNDTQASYYESLLDAADLVDDGDYLILAPTTIFSYDPVTFTEGVTIEGDADVNLKLSDAVNFTGLSSSNNLYGGFTISKDVNALSSAGITNSSNYLFTEAITFSGFTGDAVKNNSGTLDIYFSTFTGNNVGVRVVNGTTIYVSSSTFNTNTKSIVVNNTFTGQTFSIYDNKFGANPAIENNDNFTVDAAYNFFNSPNGPTHVNNPCGNGSLVTGLVTYEPWYTTNALTTTASNIANNIITHSNVNSAEYCAYPNSTTTLNGTLPTGGNGTYTYQWFRGGNAISGATSQNLTSHLLDVAGTYTFTRKVTSNNCTNESASIQVIVNPLPNVPTVTGNTSFCFVDNTTLTVSNVQSGMTYQWYKGGNIINGATNTSLLINSGLLNGGETASFTVRAITNKGCFVASNGTNVTRLPQLSVAINNGNANYTSCANTIAALTTNVTPSGTYTYVWKKNGAVISGANSSTYTIPSTDVGTNNFSVEATNTSTTPNCTTTDDIAVTIFGLPNVPTISGDNTICFGTSNIISVSNVQQGITYQWYKDNVIIQNATNTTLTINSNGAYTVRGTNTNGCVVASANFNATVLNQFTASISNVQYCSNATPVNLVANVTNVEGYTYSYQWYENNVAINGATSSTFTRTNTTPGTYTYKVEVTLTTNNEGCMVTSNNATITIFQTATPSVSGNQLVCENSAIALTSSNTNQNATVTAYQWFLNGNMISGATNSTYNKANATLADQGNYTVRMTTNNGCQTTSSNYYVEISELAKINNFAFNNTITNGNITSPNNLATSFREDLSITYTLTADSAITYRWFFNGTQISGQSGSTLTLNYATIKNLFTGPEANIFTTTFPVYAVAVSANSCTNATSLTTNLTVVPLPTKLEIVDISNPVFNNTAKMETAVSYNVTVNTRNNLNVLSPVTMATGLNITINDATVDLVVNGNAPVTIPINANTVTFPVTLTKAVGAVNLQLTAATSSGMTLTSDNTANFVLVPALPSPPTNLRRTSRSRTTLSMAWNISTTAHNSLILTKQGAYAGTANDKPVDGTAYIGDADFTTAASLGAYKVVYSGNARTLTITALTRGTTYDIKAFAVAGDFASGREATLRYSAETQGTTTSQQATSNKEGEEFFETQEGGSFVVETIFPNPVRDVLNFNIINELAGEFKVEVMTVTGQIVSVPFTNLNLGVGSFVNSFNIDGLAAGSYMLIVTANDHAHVVPFVIVK